MIESKNDASKNLEKALQALEQAKQRVANEKKQNEKKRKAEATQSPRLRGAHRYTTRVICALSEGQVSLAMDNASKLKASLPNDWSYELAEEVVRDYVNFIVNINTFLYN
ncbi:MAG: hypothetical protein HDR09_00815 [Lachnospiraceae bacterium]|nr:hypothetical protein [Lachnospiraceae bacterium]